MNEKNSRPRQIVTALGGVEPYRLSWEVNWNEIERQYGPRFKDAKLYSHYGDDYENNEDEIWLIVAPDVNKVEEAICEAILEQVRRGDDLSQLQTISVIEYQKVCDNYIAWKHGFVFAYHSGGPLVEYVENNLETMFTKDEKRVIKKQENIRRSITVERRQFLFNKFSRGN